jgi:hypothetical protein
MSNKAALLRSYLEERGVSVPAGYGWRKVSCFGPGHSRGDRNPSASVNLTSGYYKCFACDMSGDVFDLYMQETGVDFRTAQTTLGGVAHREEETWL